MDKMITDAALQLPSTYMTEQWHGSHVFKVGTRETFKMFAILNPGHERLTVKAPSVETRTMLIEVGVASMHSHMPRGSWMVLHLDQLEPDDVVERLTASYSVVLPGLPRRVRDHIAPI